MGKSQKQRAMRRHNPVRVPDSHLPQGLAAASNSSTKKDAILPIMQKLSSADASERKWACVAVSNLIQNDPSTRRLLQGKNVVGSLITRLSDNEEEVVAEAAGALRNLCIDGGYDICGEMYNKNILSPLKTFIPKISAILSQYLEDAKSAPENARKLVYELAENVITIIWCLSETSNKALNAINDMELVPFLMSFLGSRSKLSALTVNAAAQCLYVLTDDNPPAIREVKSNASYITCLVDIVQQPSTNEVDPKAAERAVMLRVLASGILRNISPLPPFTAAAAIDLESEVILPLLQPLISSISLSSTVDEVHKLLTQQDDLAPQVDKISLKGTPKSDHRTPTETELDRTEHRLRTIQLALEILTGVCATLPEYEPNNDEPEDIDDEEDMGEGANEDASDNDNDDDMETELNGVSDSPTTNDSEKSPSYLSPLVEPLLHLIQPTSLSFPPKLATGGGPSPHPPTTSVLSAIHVCALECLNNLFLSLATSGHPVNAASDAAAGQTIWDAVWRALESTGTDTSGPGQERRRDVWDMSVGVLWGVGSVWRGALTPREEHVTLLTQFCEASSDDVVRVKCVGALQSLAEHPTSIEINRVIAEYFFTLLPTKTSPTSRVGTEAAIQALSSLIDIYSDEDRPYDVNFRTGGYLQRLREASEGVRRAVKMIDRKKPGGKELRLRAEETRDNLVAFVKYRERLKL